MLASPELDKGIWYLTSEYGTFEMESEYIAQRIADIINAAYEQGKRDKVAELRESLYIYDELYE